MQQLDAPRTVADDNGIAATMEHPVVLRARRNGICTASRCAKRPSKLEADACGACVCSQPLHGGMTSIRRWFAAASVGVATGAALGVPRRAFFRAARCEDDVNGTDPLAADPATCHKKTWGIPWIDDWDNAAERGIESRSRRVKRQLLLVRHGQYRNEKASKDDSEHVLTELGVEQAEFTGRYLRAAIEQSPLYHQRRVNVVYVSDLMRAKQTCEHMLAGVGDLAPPRPIVDSMLREIFPCDPQPPYPKKARPECERLIEATYSKYFHRPTADESTVDVIVAHGNVIRYCLCRALQIPPEAWLRFSLPHCSITSVTIDGAGRVSVNAVGSAGHLPPHLQSVSNVA